MAKLIADDIRVCSPCLAYIANGETGDESDDAKARKGVEDLLRVYEAEGGSVVTAGDENEEGFFSWSSCQCCDDSGGGMRYLAGIIL